MNPIVEPYNPPFQLTYEMYNNPQRICNLKKLTELNNIPSMQNPTQSRYQTACSESNLFKDQNYYGSYQNYLNTQYQDEGPSRNRRRSKSKSDDFNLQRGDNIVRDRLRSIGMERGRSMSGDRTQQINLDNDKKAFERRFGYGDEPSYNKRAFENRFNLRKTEGPLNTVPGFSQSDDHRDLRQPDNNLLLYNRELINQNPDGVSLTYQYNNAPDKTLFSSNANNIFNEENPNAFYNPITANYFKGKKNVMPGDQYSPIVTSLDQISHLSPQDQIMVLFNNNMALAQRLTDLTSQYDKLKGEYDQLIKLQGIEKTNTSKDFKNLLIKENGELKRLNKNYEAILEPMIDYINDVNSSLGKGEIDINQIRKMVQEGGAPQEGEGGQGKEGIEKSKETFANTVDQLKDFLGHCQKTAIEALDALDETGEKRAQRGGKLTKGAVKGKKGAKGQFKDGHWDIIKNVQMAKDQKQSGPQERTNKFMSTDDHFYDYYPGRDFNCFACNLGINNSSRGYSPLMCSPNRKKYISPEQK